MPVSAEYALNILATLGRNPAVAFHEAPVAAAVKSILAGAGLAADSDTFGNIICRLPGQDPGETPWRWWPTWTIRASRRWITRAICS